MVRPVEPTATFATNKSTVNSNENKEGPGGFKRSRFFSAKHPVNKPAKKQSFVFNQT